LNIIKRNTFINVKIKILLYPIFFVGFLLVNTQNVVIIGYGVKELILNRQTY
jgi:hypothetical protein